VRGVLIGAVSASKQKQITRIESRRSRSLPAEVSDGGWRSWCGQTGGACMSVGERGKDVPFRLGTPGWAVGRFPSLGQSFAPGSFSLFCFYLIFLQKLQNWFIPKPKFVKNFPCHQRLIGKRFWSNKQ
jgi:hypothetical protein